MWVERPDKRVLKYSRTPKISKKIIGSGMGSNLKEVKIGNFYGVVKTCRDLEAAMDNVKFYRIFRSLGLPVPKTLRRAGRRVFMTDLSERGRYLVQDFGPNFFHKENKTKIVEIENIDSLISVFLDHIFLLTVNRLVACSDVYLFRIPSEHSGKVNLEIFFADLSDIYFKSDDLEFPPDELLLENVVEFYTALRGWLERNNSLDLFQDDLRFRFVKALNSKFPGMGSSESVLEAMEKGQW